MPKHRPVATRPHVVRRKRSSLPIRREEVGVGSRSVGRGFRARVPGAPELSEECQSSRTRRSSWGPAGTVSEIRRNGRAREGGQIVGGRETTCRTFALRVGSGEPTPPPTNGSYRLRTGIGSVESLCSMRGERRSRGRSRSLPNPSPDFFTGELQRGSVVNRGSRLSSVMETLIDNAESSARSNQRFNPM